MASHIWCQIAVNMYTVPGFDHDSVSADSTWACDLAEGLLNCFIMLSREGKVDSRKRWCGNNQFWDPQGSLHFQVRAPSFANLRDVEANKGADMSYEKRFEPI